MTERFFEPLIMPSTRIEARDQLISYQEWKELQSMQPRARSWTVTEADGEAMLDFDTFVHKAGILAERQALFHGWVLDLYLAGGQLHELLDTGKTYGTWKLLYKAFCQEADLHDQQEMQADVLEEVTE